MSVLFQNVNPERGRKRDLEKVKGLSITPFQNVNPERGRKRVALYQALDQSTNRFQNVNPERGRKLTAHRILPFTSSISEREPRKGTETLL